MGGLLVSRAAGVMPSFSNCDPFDAANPAVLLYFMDIAYTDGIDDSEGVKHITVPPVISPGRTR